MDDEHDDEDSPQGTEKVSVKDVGKVDRNPQATGGASNGLIETSDCSSFRVQSGPFCLFRLAFRHNRIMSSSTRKCSTFPTLLDFFVRPLPMALELLAPE